MLELFLVSLEKSIGSSQRLVWDQVVDLVINCESEGWEPHVGFLFFTNVAVVGELPMLAEGV